MPEGHPAPRDGGASLQVKICGLTRPEDAALAGRLGADRVGVILVPDTPRFRTAVEARELGEAAGVPLVVVVGDAPAEEVAEWAHRAGAAAIQLHGGLRPPGDAGTRGGDRAPDASPGVAEGHDLDTMAWLRAQGPWELWKVLRVRSGVEILPAARRWEAAADLLLLDAWHPTQLGGSGTTFSWAALESVRTAWPPSLGLGVAGGLRPESVAEAVHRLRPRLVDVSSGVEASPGVKDPAKLRAFLDAARQAMARLDDDGVPAARRRPSHPSSPLPS